LAAERCCAELGRHTRAGEVVLDRISRVVMGARPLLDAPAPAPAPQPEPRPLAPAHDLNSIAAAARALSERARGRKAHNNEPRIMKLYEDDQPVDLLGRNGFAVAPPSLFEQGFYEFVRGGWETLIVFQSSEGWRT
jgi:hypothetical protein